MSEISEPKRSAAYLAAEAMVPEHLHSVLKQLVSEYQFAALKTHGYPLVSPRVIAELVLMGWRSSALPQEKP